MTEEMSDREMLKFNHPTETEWKKLSSSGWLEGIPSSSLVQELETKTERGEVDLDYEIYYINVKIVFGGLLVCNLVFCQNSKP